MRYRLGEGLHRSVPLGHVGETWALLVWELEEDDPSTAVKQNPASPGFALTAYPTSVLSHRHPEFLYGVVLELADALGGDAVVISQFL
jgi:hypothetical protein